MARISNKKINKTGQMAKKQKQRTTGKKKEISEIKRIIDKNGVPVYHCPVRSCISYFRDPESLSPHLQKAHKNQKVNCKKCGKELNSSSLSRHMAEIHGKIKPKDDKKKCPKCSDKPGKNMRRHIHKESSNICIRCDLTCGDYEERLRFFHSKITNDAIECLGRKPKPEDQIERDLKEAIEKNHERKVKICLTRCDDDYKNKVIRLTREIINGAKIPKIILFRCDDKDDKYQSLYLHLLD